MESSQNHISGNPTNQELLNQWGGNSLERGVLSTEMSALNPGQAVEVESCDVRGNGSAKDDYVRLLVYVDKVDFEDCHYKPSLRIPRSLKVHTVW